LKKTGLYAPTKADVFNILCLPVDPTDDTTALDPTLILEPALAFCEQQRAMLIVDPPHGWPRTQIPDFPTVTGDKKALNRSSPNAAIYFPNLTTKDRTGAPKTVGPSGAIAGVWAATDTERGVWKAPAGTAASIAGITEPEVHIGDGESGQLNPVAVNALRTLPEIGPVVWGARTSVGGDQDSNQWKYIPVRRTALFIEESLRRGTQWVVFEPNDEPLWSSIRLNVGTFMNGLFRKGAFQGSTPAEAYLVKCDKDNNPQDQIDLGIVNILVGFAPLKPAEFVIISIQQQAGQA
ncbi:MAG: phage tail sheath family protein, partial [Ilumatobacteraceae bacterium]